MAFQGRKDGITSTELQSLKASTERFLGTTERRLSDLVAFRKVLSSGATEAQVREIAAKYHGPMRQSYPMGGDIKSIRSSLLATIEAEDKSLREAVELGRTLLNSLERIGAGQAGKIKLKLSILHRGNTDGLIRHVGEIKMPSAGLTLRIMRSAPPEKPISESLLAMTVPTTVMNPPTDVEWTTSVGKVEKKSMNEFWFDVDESLTPQETLVALWRLVSEGKLSESVVVLFDHQNKSVTYRFPSAHKSKIGGEARRDRVAIEKSGKKIDSVDQRLRE